MDQEHQRIVELMNQLHKLYSAGAPRGEQEQTLNALVDVTVKHFADEERYMATIRFPGLAPHQIIHKRLVGELGTHIEAFKRTGKLSDEMFHFLTFWLQAHIQGVDKKYGEHKAL